MSALAHFVVTCFAYVVLCLLTVEVFYQRPVLVKLLWILSIGSTLQLVWATGRSKALKVLGWLRWVLGLAVAMPVTLFLCPIHSP